MATIRSWFSEAVTSTPVRCGRVSSRDAARATRPMMSTKASVGTLSVEAASLASGSFGKSSMGSVRRWKLAEPETSSTSCSLAR